MDTPPAQLSGGSARVFVIFHQDVIFLAGDKLDGAADGRGGLVLPLIHQELAVNPQPRAVVSGGGERVEVAKERLDLAVPAYLEAIDRQTGIRRARAKVEIDDGVEPGQGWQAREVGGTIGVSVVITRHPGPGPEGRHNEAHDWAVPGLAEGIGDHNLVAARIAQLDAGYGQLAGRCACDIGAIKLPLERVAGGRARQSDAEAGAPTRCDNLIGWRR